MYYWSNKRRGEREWAETIFREVTEETFPKLELQPTARRINAKETTLRHITVRILKAKFRETLKAAGEKKILYTGS